MRTQSRRISQSWIPMLASFLVTFSPAWTSSAKAQTAPGEPGTKMVAAKTVEKAVLLTTHSDSRIERVRVTRREQQIEVRVEGSGHLSCTPFRLREPDRLVLDFSGAAMYAQQPALPSGLQPVRAVRVDQFKTGVARLVIDLDGPVPYALISNGDVVTVTFGPAPVREPIVVPKRNEESHLLDKVGSADPGPRPSPNGEENRNQQKSEPKPLARPVAGVNSMPARADSPASPQVEREPTPAPNISSGAPTPAQPQASPYIGKPISVLPTDDYVIGPQDVLAINVWREPELSRIEPVRPDGKISLPLIGDVRASGLTPKMLQTEISKALEAYLRKPEVAVIVQEANSHKFNIVGEVQRPGSYLLASNMTALDALAAAGGFRDFAKTTKIYLLRRTPDGSSVRIPFNYKKAIRGRERDLDLQLLPGDTIVVP
jgi:polysaccharide export outer membrane protein